MPSEGFSAVGIHSVPNKKPWTETVLKTGKEVATRVKAIPSKKTREMEAVTGSNHSIKFFLIPLCAAIIINLLS
jgi:hypothetical protein